MSQSLTVIQLGNPILRHKAQEVANTPDEQIQQLIDNLILTVATTNGVGIASPQVGESYRVFIMASRPNPRYPHAPEMEPTAIINPRIIAYSGEVIKGWEGCLSVPGIRGLVPRYQTITVEYFDRNGQLQKQQFTNFLSRIFQHEIDHLNGVIFLDRVETTLDLMTEQEYQNRIISNN